MELYLAIKNEIHFQETELNITILSKANQIQKDKYFMLSPMWSQRMLFWKRKKSSRNGEMEQEQRGPRGWNTSKYMISINEDAIMEPITS